MRRRSYTLLEMTIAIGVLAVVSVFVVRLFALASDIQRKSRDLDAACFGAQTMMEAARVRDGNGFAVLTEVWPGGVHPAGWTSGAQVYEAYFDRDWRSVPVRDERGFVFRMEVNVSPAGGEAQWRACTFAAYGLSGTLLEEVRDAPLYTLQAGCYVPYGVGV